MSIEGVDTNGHAGVDQGVEAETRARPCALRTWCVLEAGHDGSCVEVPRASQPTPDYGPKRNRGKR